jgi:E3 ubiquitin-protein ligase TRIP12
LVAGDDSDIPRSLHNIVVSIHAIATFQALHDYLRPRVAGLLSSGRLSGMLSALAAAGHTPGSSSNHVGEESRQGQAAQNPTPPGTGSSTAASSDTSVGRRRSLRLSAKNASASVTTAGDGKPTILTPESGFETSSSEPVPYGLGSASSIEAAPSETAVDSELQAEFTDDEVDAEVNNPKD